VVEKLRFENTGEQPVDKETCNTDEPDLEEVFLGHPEQKLHDLDGSLKCHQLPHYDSEPLSNSTMTTTWMAIATSPTTWIRMLIRSILSLSAITATQTT
jgi:hypothetical protein